MSHFPAGNFFFSLPYADKIHTFVPEIAAAMLQRQQASAIINARKMMADGAVGMVKTALDLNMNQNTISRYEPGENDIPTRILIQLADFYQTSTDYLLGRTDNIKPYEK